MIERLPSTAARSSTPTRSTGVSRRRMRPAYCGWRPHYGSRRAARGGTRPAGGAGHPSDGGEREGGEAALRAQHRHGRDGLVLLARAGRPDRRREARDRRAVLLARSSSTRRAGCWARARRPRGGSTRPAWSPTSTATACKEIVVGGNDGTVAAYDLGAGGLQLKPGWPASTCSGGQCPETRGMAAADLDGDGRIEVVATTTNTSPTGSQVFVFDRQRRATRPAGRGTARADATFNGVGNHGYGAYGENVGIGQPRRRPAARGRRHVRQPPDQRLQPRRHVGARVAVVHEPPERPRRAPARLGPVHPLAEPAGRGRPLPPPRRRLAGRATRRRGCSGRPRRRRSPTSTATAATRSSASRTSRRRSRTRRRRTRSWCSTARTATGRARRAGTRASGGCR